MQNRERAPGSAASCLGKGMEEELKAFAITRDHFDFFSEANSNFRGTA